MLHFKTARGARRFQVVFITTSLLVLFSRPIWDFVLHPIYDTYTDFRGWRGII